MNDSATRSKADDSGSMKQQRSPKRPPSILPWSVAGIVILLMVVALVAGIMDGTGPVELLLSILPQALYAVVGSIIVSRSQANRVGWLLLAIGAAGALDSVIHLVALEDPPSRLTPGWFLLLLNDQVAWMIWLFPLFLLICVFPTGSLPSRRWRWVPILEAVMFATLTAVVGFGKEIGPFSGAWSLPNRFGFIDGSFYDSAVLLVPWALGLVALSVGSVTSIVMRYRRADDVERAQLKWVLYAVVVFGVIYALMLATEGWSDDSVVGGAALFVGVGGIAGAIAVAVLKFHLYDIDIIISRSLTFGVLAVFIGGVYVGIVVGVGSLFGQADGSNVGLSVAATAVVALAFQPVRGRVERWANRLVYGKRATPYEVLARFSHRSAEESDEDVLVRIPRLIVDGTGASSAMVWVRSGDGFRTASVWPESDAVRTLDGDVGFVDPEADVSWPVFHDGELLGGISLVAARGGVITPPERELVTRLADGLGLTLRNSRLTAELRRQVRDLQRSRDRVVSAADEARRSLEHDLDSGPQQLLVAAKVKLGPLRKLAEQAGAVRTAEVLADIEVNAGEAIRAVRDFAAGIYPPLLGAEGLAVALSQETRKAALPVDLETDGVGRYSREVESAVYFSILEALQNTAKYAEASRAVVRLTAGSGDLRFEVSDDGKGFDPATVRHGAGLNGIADRLDTIGGIWTITSSSGGGTVVAGTVPVEASVAI